MFVSRALLSRICAALAAVMFLSVTVPPVANARVIGTEEAAAPHLEAAEARHALLSVLARADVQGQMRAWGVSPVEAEARVHALSDAEAVTAAARLPFDPAGQDTAGALIGAALVIFVVLLFTDLLGLTNVFWFTRDSRR